MASHYREAGVDIDAATRAVDMMKAAVRATHSAAVLADVGSFGGLFALENLPAQPVLVASTDVHEFAKFLLTSTFDAAGSKVIDCGINRDPEDIVKVALETAADAIVITTHNGVARSFGTKLTSEMRNAQLDAAVFMGGVLNEDIEGSDIPVDVRGDLHGMGIATPGSIDQPFGTRSAGAPSAATSGWATPSASSRATPPAPGAA